MLELILIVILILLLLGALPLWPYNSPTGVYGQAGYNAGWGYWPGGIVGILLLLLIVYLFIHGGRF